MEWVAPVDLSLVGGKLRCPNFVEVLDYSIFKNLDICLKYETYWRFS